MLLHNKSPKNIRGVGQQITERQARSRKEEMTCLRSHLLGVAFGKKLGWRILSCPALGCALALELDLPAPGYVFRTLCFILTPRLSLPVARDQ